jgi:hypothetical protein
MAAAIGPDAWYARLQTWLPTWFFANQQHQDAVLTGVAETLAEGGSEVDSLIGETFITRAGQFLSTHGDERGVYKKSTESDDQFRLRVQRASSASNLGIEDIRATVAAMINGGTSYWVHPDYECGSFCDRSYFCNRRDVVFDVVTPGFTVFVDNQANPSLLQLIADAIREQKAFGVVFRFIERF